MYLLKSWKDVREPYVAIPWFLLTCKNYVEGIQIICDAFCNFSDSPCNIYVLFEKQKVNSILQESCI